MNPNEIKDKKSFIKYVKLIEFYEKNTIHNVYKISSYIFSKILNKQNQINNLFNYFSKSFSENINKLNNNLLKNNLNIIPEWLNKDIKKEEATENELEEINDILSDYK
ncbi:MAG: hypothetical protein J6K23_06400 [Bacilli bacterium]|nr:hypothetical protein [Bacilli bacterium]